MKKSFAAVVIAAALAVSASPVWAISSHHRASLSHGSCTQVDEAEGRCGAGVAQPKPVRQAAHICTQVEDAQGLCDGAKHSQAKAPRIHYIKRHGVRLPQCEDVGGSQADNGNTCWY